MEYRTDLGLGIDDQENNNNKKIENTKMFIQK